MPNPDLGPVLEHPLDDAPRLAFADALGADPRAELIRIQLRHRSHGGTAREQELLIAHLDSWLAEVAPLVQMAGLQRGFVEFASMTADQWLKNATQLFAVAPLLDMHLSGVAGRPEVFAVPQLARLRSLNLAHNRLDDADAVALAASPYVRGLRWLDLTNNQIGHRGLDAIAASPNLPVLQWLGFADNVAPDPVPFPVLDYGVINAVVTPAIHAQLVAKVGPKPWLTARNSDAPPEPGEV